MNAAWFRDAARGLRDEVEHELQTQPGQPDLADVLARARALDAEAVPPSLSAVELDTSDEVPDEPAPLLDAFTQALRDQVEDDVDDRAMLPARASSRRAMPWLLVGAVAAAAVLLTMAFGAQSLQPADAPQSEQASKSARESDDEKAWQRRPDPRRAATPTPPSPRPAVAPAPAPSPSEPPPEAPRSKAPRPSLDALEQQAMAAWRAGELAKAERLLRRIIARAGRGPKAELAFGDLFALTKQRGGAAGQRKAWRQYLRRFPRGQHADDARAGLCMHTSGDAATRCWGDYLDTHPNGAHARRARRVLE